MAGLDAQDQERRVEVHDLLAWPDKPVFRHVVRMGVETGSDAVHDPVATRRYAAKPAGIIVRICGEHGFDGRTVERVDRPV